ncbi:FxsA family protein [Thermodesulfobacteriota bacterium]
MFFKLFLAFALIPVIEIYLLIELGSVFGALNTIILVILTAFAGAYLARLQGYQTMLRVRASLQQGIMPTDDLIDAVIIFVAGIVLLTPGFLTDTTGLLLLFPGTRRPFKKWIKYKFKHWARSQNIHYRH